MAGDVPSSSGIGGSDALTIIQTACQEMGIKQPSSAYSTPDVTATQLGALFNATGEMLVKRRVWRMLFREFAFAGVEGQADYPLPPDFARPISQTEWDTTNRWPMIGPETPQQWQWLKSGILSTGPRERFRLVGNAISIWPVPGANQNGGGIPLPVNFSYYYISKWWANDASGQLIPKCTNDTDVSMFDDRLMTSGVKLRYFQVKGFDTQAFAAEFQSNLDDALAQDSGAPILSLARQPAFPLITIYNVPDGNWPAYGSGL